MCSQARCSTVQEHLGKAAASGMERVLATEYPELTRAPGTLWKALKSMCSFLLTGQTTLAPVAMV
jgi:hypothetical protein